MDIFLKSIQIYYTCYFSCSVTASVHKAQRACENKDFFFHELSCELSFYSDYTSTLHTSLKVC